MSEKDRDRLDLAKLLADIGTLNDDELGDAVSELLDSPDVTDTLEGLRRHVDDLFERLDFDPQPQSAQSVEGEGFESHVEALGRKMDATSALLAELTDVLESQTERIETIEEQLGDPDVAYVDEPQRVPLEPEPAIERSVLEATENAQSGQDDCPDETDPNDVFREFLNERLDRLESRVSDIENRIADVKALALSRDGRVRMLEERVVSLVEAGRERRRVAAAVPVFGAARPAEVVPDTSASVAAIPRVTAGVSCADAPLHRDSTTSLSHEENGASHIRYSGEDSASRFAVNAGSSESALPAEPAGTDPQSFASEPAPQSGTPAATKAAPEAVQAAPGSAAVSGQISAHDKLADLVEREVRTRREFTEGAVQTGALGHPTIMVVDDSADARTILSIYLSRAGYNVVAAHSAEDCLARLRHHAVDAIVLDARMPGADGGHVCRMLREDAGLSRLRDLPVIVYTAYPDQYPKAVAEKWGATEYLVKGGDMLPLITALVRHTGVDAAEI